MKLLQSVGQNFCQVVPSWLDIRFRNQLASALAVLLSATCLHATNPNYGTNVYSFDPYGRVSRMECFTRGELGSRWVAISLDAEPLGHEGNQVVHAGITEYDRQGLPETSRPIYCLFIGDLDEEGKIPELGLERLVYCDEVGEYLLPMITQ